MPNARDTVTGPGADPADALGAEPRPSPGVTFLGASVLLVVLAAAVAVCSSPTGTDGLEEVDPDDLPTPDVRATVDGSRTHQEIVGFGGDIGPWHFSSLDDAARDRLLRDIVGEMGINSFRMNLVPYEGASPGDRWGQNDDADPSTIDWTRFDFCVEPDRCNDEWAEMIPVLREAGATGLYWGLIQGPRWNGFDGESSFSVDEMAENQLAAFLHFRDEHGIRVDRLAPFSEPSGGGIDWPITADQARRAVIRLGERLETNGFSDVRMIVPDAVAPGPSAEYGRVILEDPAARPYVGALGFHAYRSGPGGESPSQEWRASRSELKEIADARGLPVRMTEFFDLRGLLARANHIYNELAFADSRTYHPQHVVSTGEHGEGGSVRTEAGAIVYFVPGDAGQVVESGPTRFTGVAIGHWSRFVPPGAVRLGVDVSGSADVRVQAFRVDGPDRLAVVVINNGPAARVEVELEGGLERRGGAGAVVSREGDADAYWSDVGEILAAGPHLLSLGVPGRSVVTLTVDR
jgi:O-glycosyl hydrolase